MPNDLNSTPSHRSMPLKADELEAAIRQEYGGTSTTDALIEVVMREYRMMERDRDMWFADDVKQNSALGRVTADLDQLRLRTQSESGRIEMPKDYPPQHANADGWTDWISPTDIDMYGLQCCDCGLKHEMQFRVMRNKAYTDGEHWFADPVPVEEGYHVAFRMKRDAESVSTGVQSATGRWVEAEKAKADAYEAAAVICEEMSYPPDGYAEHHNKEDEWASIKLEDAAKAIRERKAKVCQVTQATVTKNAADRGNDHG